MSVNAALGSISALDILHGTAVADPYRWLEDPVSESTRRWIVQQQQQTNSYFSRVASYEAIQSRVGEALRPETIDQVSKVAGRLFYSRRSADAEQPSIMVFDEPLGVERALLEPLKEMPFVSRRIHRISENSELLAFETRFGGEQSCTVEFLNVESGLKLSDRIERGFQRGLALEGNQGFYFCSEPAPPTVERHPNHEIRFHAFGQPSNLDQTIFSRPRRHRSRLVLTADNVQLGAIYTYELQGNMLCDLWIASRSDSRHWLPIFEGAATPLGPFLCNGHVYIQTYASRAEGEVLQLDHHGEVASVIIPNSAHPVRQVITAGDYLLSLSIVGFRTLIQVWSLR
jgi:prolyl oligopeptidase